MNRKKGVPVHGWLVLDKPTAMTAATAVAKVKHALNAAKAGHAGTLDPLATGVLPIALGEATKTVSFAMDGAKTYEFEVLWGSATDTDDCAGKIIAESPVRPALEAIKAALPAFTGTIQQIPPDYSAIKVQGRRAYDMARNKEALDLAPRAVTIHRFELTEMTGPDRAKFTVDCGKGTYIRALVRDLGQALGTLAHITALRRTRCGPFMEKQAISLEKLVLLGDKAAASDDLLPIGTVLDDIPALALTEEEARRMTSGQSIALWPVAKRSPLSGLTQGTPVQARLGDRLIAVGEVGNGMVRPVRVLNQ